MRKIILLTLLGAAMSTAAETPARTFSWLSGHWCGGSAGELIEEFWLPEEGDVAVGVGRTVKAGKTTSLEFMRIEARDGETHFIATLPGQEPTKFKLMGSGADWARFENPQHDFPKRVEFRRSASGLHAEIAGPGDDGKEQVIPFDYRRCVD
jgi:uncharacterized protein DUF6265